MARLAGEKNAKRPLAVACRADAQADAAPRASRALAGNRSNRRLVQNCWRIHRCALDSVRVTRRNALCPHPPAGFTLRTRASFKDRHPAKIKATLRRTNHSRRSFSRWLMLGDSVDEVRLDAQ